MGGQSLTFYSTDYEQLLHCYQGTTSDFFQFPSNNRPEGSQVGSQFIWESRGVIVGPDWLISGSKMVRVVHAQEGYTMLG